MPFNLPGLPFSLTAEGMGVPDYQKAIRSGFDTFQKGAEAINTPAKLAEALLASKLQNKINQPKADRAYEITDADLRNTIANTGLTSANTFKQNILNKFLPQREQTELRNLDSTTGLNTQNTLKQQILNQYLREHERTTIDHMKEQIQGLHLANHSTSELEKIYEQNPNLRLPKMPVDARFLMLMQTYPELFNDIENNTSPEPKQDLSNNVLQNMFNGQGPRRTPEMYQDKINQGLFRQGNINLHNRPQVKNPDGSISTVLSMGVGLGDGKEALIPRVSDDGRILSEQEAIEQFKRTGKHLGIYNSQKEADQAAEQLHQQQQQEYTEPKQTSQQLSLRDKIKQAAINRLSGVKNSANRYHGPAAEVNSHFEYMKEHPAGTPEGDEELKQWDMKNSSRNILNESREMNTHLAPTKLLTTDAKHAKELDMIDSGKNPYNGEPLTKQRQAELRASYSAKEGNLQKGDSYIFDPVTKERIGIQHKTTEAEKKEIEGRDMFMQLSPIVTRGLSQYSGKGSYTRFVSDANNYKSDANAKKRIDAFLLARNLLTAEKVKENATLGGANTNQVYKQLDKTLNSSDIKPIIEDIVKGQLLPSAAMARAGYEAPKVIDRTTKHAQQHVPATIKSYFDDHKPEATNESHNAAESYAPDELVIVNGPNGEETMTYAKAKELGAV